MEEASRLGQQKDPYMQQMMMSSGLLPPNEMSSNWTTLVLACRWQA